MNFGTIDDSIGFTETMFPIYQKFIKWHWDRDSGQGSTKTDAVKLDDHDLYLLVKRVMSYIDKNQSLDKISKKTGADRAFVEDVARMYLTHQHVGVQGILDRIEIKGK